MISFIIPTLNEEKALPATIAALRQLQGVSYEIIVADSGSTDATRSIAARQADLVVGYDEGRKSAARGRNLGASVAHGELLAFLDADVHVPRVGGSFAFVETLFADDPQLAGIAPFVGVTPELARLSDRLSYALVNMHFFLRNNWLGSGISNGDLQVVRTNAFRALGGYDESLANSEDNELFARLAARGRTRIVPWLHAYHSPRRERAWGWPRLWYRWIINAVSMLWRNRPAHDTWEPVR